MGFFVFVLGFSLGFCFFLVFFMGFVRNPKVWFYFEDIIKNDRFIIEHVFRTFKLDLEGIGLKNNNLQESIEFCKMPFFLFSSLNYSQNEKVFLKKLMMAYCTNNTKNEVFKILKQSKDHELSGTYLEYFVK